LELQVLAVTQLAATIIIILIIYIGEYRFFASKQGVVAVRSSRTATG